MAGIFNGIVKGLASLAPQDNPDIMIFNAQTEIKEIGEKEKELFAELGKQVYESAGKEAYPEITAQLDEIKAKREELEAKIKQIKEEKEAKERAENQETSISEGNICPACGTSNNDGAKFCSGCGGKLPEPVTVENKKRFCTSCGKEVAEGMRFCSSCGASQE